jgi:glutathione S-transferase
MPTKPILYHIPVCPFSQRVEILLELKGLRGAVDFSVVDITKPRDPALLAKTRGTTALPVLDLGGGRILKESLVLLRYVEDLYPEPRVARADPYERAVENMLIALEDPFVSAGYRFVMNQDPSKRPALAAQMTEQYRRLDDFLTWHAPAGDFLFERFGLAECVFTSIFARFWFLDYYEGWDIPAEFSRVRRWREACLAHPCAGQVSREEIVKCYYDYAWGAGNGALLPGRKVSSFVFEPHWRSRPWPPAGKLSPASDAQLGLIA